MMQHTLGCTFEDSVRERFFGTIGQGEISGAASFGRDSSSGKVELSLSDGWTSTIYMPFKFCPICGAKLD